MTTGNNNENPYGDYVPGQYSNSGKDANPSGASEAQGNYQVGDYQQNSAANGPTLNGGANYSAPNTNYSAPADYSAGGYNNYQQGYGAPVKAPGTGLGIASLVLGIIAIITCWFAIGGLAGLIGLILGIIAIVKLRKTPGSKKGLAITGTILSAIGLVIGAVMTVFLLWAGSIAMDGVTQCQSYLESNDQAGYEQCITEWTENELGVTSTTGTSNS